MNKFTVVVTWSYTMSDEDLQRYYDTSDLEAAALIDETNYTQEPGLIGEEISLALPEDLKIQVLAHKQGS